MLESVGQLGPFCVSKDVLVRLIGDSKLAHVSFKNPN